MLLNFLYHAWKVRIEAIFERIKRDFFEGGPNQKSINVLEKTEKSQLKINSFKNRLY
jgi:hypothetical protein